MAAEETKEEKEEPAKEGEGDGGKPADSGKSKKRREQILIGATILGVIVAYLIYRNNASSSASTDPSSGMTPSTEAGVAPGPASVYNTTTGVTGLSTTNNTLKQIQQAIDRLNKQESATNQHLNQIVKQTKPKPTKPAHHVQSKSVNPKVKAG